MTLPFRAPFTRSVRRLLAAGLLAAGAAAGAAPAPAPAPAARVIVGYLPQAPLVRETPVRFRSDALAVRAAHQRRADALARRVGVALTAGRAVGGRAHVVMAQGLSSAELAARLAEDPAVAFAVVDERRRALAWPGGPADPLFDAGPAGGRGPDAGQWYLRAPTDLFRSAANVQGAWARTTGSPSVVVAVLDSGVLFDHVDLQDRLLPGHDMVSSAAYANDGGGRDASAADPGDWISAADHASSTFRGCAIEDSSWHGTKVAGIIGAATDNGIGMAGIAPGARILPVRVLGKCGGFDSDIVAGMLWAAGVDQPGLPASTTPARVLNLSLGGDGACSTIYREAVAQVVDRGAVVVAAAGNTVGRAVGTPANCPGVLAVAGLRHAGSKVGFSDLGPEIAIGAPGGNCINIRDGEPCLYPILTASNSGRTSPAAGGSIFTDSFDISVGTSFATPIVAGAVALMLSVRPELSPAEVRRVLQASARAYPSTGADNGPDDPSPVVACQPPSSREQLQCYCTTALCGAGMLDAAAAVAGAADGVFARVEVATAGPVAGSAVALSGAGSLAPAGRTIVAWRWTLVDGGGIASGLAGADNASTASLLPSAAGTVVVRLTVTDDLGTQASVDRAIEVASAGGPPVVPAPVPPATGGGGGGAAAPAWLALLALAVWALRHGDGSPSRGCPAGRLPATADNAGDRRFRISRMSLSTGSRRLVCALAAGLAAAAFLIPAPAQAAAGADTAQPVRGLIVRLKNAPANARLHGIGLNDRERTLAAGERDAETARWRQVQRHAGLEPSSSRAAPSMRPVGRDQQLLTFERPLAPAQARALIERLKSHGDVDWVEVNTRERRLSGPLDPYFTDGSQWWLLANGGSDGNVMSERRRGVAGFQRAWLQPGGTGSVSPAVAVLDTGITAHPDLFGRLLPGRDFVSEAYYANDGDGWDGDPSDPGDWVSLTDLSIKYPGSATGPFDGCAVVNSSWHGTVIAGMVAALTNNDEGGAAINWQGRVLPVRVAGKCGADRADIIDGMRWAAGLDVVGAPRNPNPARIVNISFGGDAACGADYQAAIDELQAIGVVVVAAAGNEHAAPTRPASCNGVVGVVGLNRDGFKSHSSNFGGALKTHGIAVASGDDDRDPSARWNQLADSGILSTHDSGSQGPEQSTYSYLFGTSFAAPQVAGAISLMLSVNPGLSHGQIVEGLRKSARPHVAVPSAGACSWDNPGRCACTTDTCGAGILDAEQALLYAANPTTYVAPARTPAVVDNDDVRAAAALGPDRDPNPGTAPPDPVPPGSDDDDSGGGAAGSAPWLLALALAAALLGSGPRREGDASGASSRAPRRGPARGSARRG